MDHEFHDIMLESEEDTAPFGCEIDIVPDSEEMEITVDKPRNSPECFPERKDNQEPESSQNKIEIFYFDCGKEPQACDEFECSLCFKIFSSEKSLATHGHRIHGTIKPFKCDVCPQRFSDKKDLTKHVAKHRTVVRETTLAIPTDCEKQESKFSCKICGEFFSKKADKFRHENQVHNDKQPQYSRVGPRNSETHPTKFGNIGGEGDNFTCRQCGELFPTKKNLDVHRVKEHPSDDELCPCKFCGEQFGPESIVGHYETRHPEAYHAQERSCHLCDAVLENRTEFRDHLRCHRNERSRRCQFCGNTYSDRSTLKRHILTQHQRSDEKRHPCTICEKECYSASRLDEHLRSHTGDKPYECGTCCKTFKSLRSVNDHRRTHTGEKPFVCEYCDKAFTHREGWKYHMRSGHGIDPVKKRANGKVDSAVEAANVSSQT